MKEIATLLSEINENLPGEFNLSILPKGDKFIILLTDLNFCNSRTLNEISGKNLESFLNGFLTCAFSRKHHMSLW